MKYTAILFVILLFFSSITPLISIKAGPIVLDGVMSPNEDWILWYLDNTYEFAGKRSRDNLPSNKLAYTAYAFMDGYYFNLFLLTNDNTAGILGRDTLKVLFDIYPFQMGVEDFGYSVEVPDHKYGGGKKMIGPNWNSWSDSTEIVSGQYGGCRTYELRIPVSELFPNPSNQNYNSLRFVVYVENYGTTHSSKIQRLVNFYPDSADVCNWSINPNHWKNLSYSEVQNLGYTHTLTMNTIGQGTVTRNPIKGEYNHDETVQLTANASPGWSFSNWSGDDNGSNNPLTVVMNSDKVINAIFVELPPLNYSININVSGQGSIEKNPVQQTYASGSTVQLTATPLQGWRFDRWSGSINHVTNPTTITVNSNMAITALFTQIPSYTLSYGIFGQGIVSKSPDLLNYLESSIVSLTAIPSAGWVFSEWSGDASGSSLSTSITMNMNKQVTATFTEIQPQTFTIQNNVFGQGNLLLSPSGGIYVDGANVQITAIPNEHWCFTGWSGNIQGVHNPINVMVTENMIVTANFEQIEYYLSIGISGLGSVIKSPNLQSYHYGDVIQLSAASAIGWEFTGWSGDVSGSYNPVTVIVDRNKAISATFTHLPAVVRINPEQIVGPPPVIGDLIDFEIKVENVYDLWGWTGRISWDSELLELVSITEGSFLSSGGQTIFLVTPESSSELRDIATTCIYHPGKSGNGVLASLRYRVKGSGSSELTVSNLRMVDSTLSHYPIPVTALSAIVRIAQSPHNPNSVFSPSNSLLLYVDEKIIFNAEGSTEGEDTLPEGSTTQNPITSYQWQIDEGNNGSFETTITGSSVEYTPVQQGQIAVKLTILSPDLIPPNHPQYTQSATLTRLYNVLGRPVPEYTLQVNINGQGTVSKTPSQESYLEGSSVQLSASAIQGWSFAGWGGDLAGQEIVKTIIIDENKVVYANFVENPVPEYTLTVTTVGEGSVLKLPDQNLYVEGSSVILNPIPASGWVFSRWGGDISGSESPKTVLIDGNRGITAIFEPESTLEYSLSIIITGAGSVIKNPNLNSYPEGSSVLLTALPAPGWVFNSWSGDITGNLNPVSLSMDAHYNIIAQFDEIPQDVVIIALDPAIVPSPPPDVGDTFVIQAKVTDVANLWGWRVEVNWDPSILEFVNIEEGPMLKQGSATIFVSRNADQSIGYIPEIACTRLATSGVFGDGALFTMTFKVKEYGQSGIIISNTRLVDSTPVHSEITHLTTNSLFSLSPPPPSGPESIFTPLNDRLFYLGDIIELDATSSTGGYDSLPAGGETFNQIIDYTWLIDYENDGTVDETLTGMLTSFVPYDAGEVAITLSVIAPDSYPPTHPNYYDTTTSKHIIQVIEPPAGPFIDLYTERGGKFFGTSSDTYGPQELVTLYANVTYNEVPVINKDVAFQIKDNDGNTIAYRTARTDNDGTAKIDYRIPWPTGPHPETLFGIWSITATVDVSQVVVSDSVTFQFGYVVEILDVQIVDSLGNLNNSVTRTQTAYVKINYKSIATTRPIRTLFTATIYDEANVALSASYTYIEIPANTEANTVFGCIIPVHSFVGVAKLYGNAYSLSPVDLGVPFCPEVSQAFSITVS